MTQLIQLDLPKRATLDPTRRRAAFNVMTKPVGAICNLDCKYCYYLEKEKLYGSKERFRMADDLLESYIQQFIEAQDIPEIQMAWQGGEPTLLGLDFFKRIVEIQRKYAGGKIIQNALQTNGTLIDDEWAQFFAENQFLIGISVDGPPRLHDKYRVDKQQRPTFHLVLRGIEFLKKHNVEFNTLTVVSRNNQDYPLEVYEFLKQIGSRHIQFIPLVERAADGNAKSLGLDLALPPDREELPDSPVTAWSVDAAKFGNFLSTIFDHWVRHDVGEVYVQIFDVALGQWFDGSPGLCVFAERCGAALALEHNGDLFSCDHYVYPQYKLGNIAQDRLLTLVNSAEQFHFGDQKHDTLPEYCRRCEVRFACNGDCPKHRFALTPDGEAGLSYLCPSYKPFFNHVAPYMKVMCNLIHNGYAPAQIMGMIATQEAQREAQLRWKTAARNDKCPCGSGKKYKQCCLGKKTQA